MSHGTSTQPHETSPSICFRAETSHGFGPRRDRRGRPASPFGCCMLSAMRTRKAMRLPTCLRVDLCLRVGLASTSHENPGQQHVNAWLTRPRVLLHGKARRHIRQVSMIQSSVFVFTELMPMMCKPCSSKTVSTFRRHPETMGPSKLLVHMPAGQVAQSLVTISVSILHLSSVSNWSFLALLPKTKLYPNRGKTRSLRTQKQTAMVEKPC